LAELSTGGAATKILAGQWQGKRSQEGLGVTILSWLILRRLSQNLGFPDTSLCFELLRSFGLDFAWQESATSEDQNRVVFLATLLTKTDNLQPHPALDAYAFTQLCQDRDNRRVLGVNSHNEQTWFLQERMTAFAGTLALQAGIMQLGRVQEIGITDATELAAECLRRRLARAAAVGYRLDKFLDLS
jgi:hypothetical protein